MKYKTIVDSSKVLKCKTLTVHFHARDDEEARAYLKKKWSDCPIITLNANTKNKYEKENHK